MSATQYSEFRYMQSRVTVIGKVVIKPGVNRVKTDLVKAWKSGNGYFKHLIENGQIIFTSGKVSDNEAVNDTSLQIPEDLSDTTISNAKSIVAEVDDIELLQTYLNVEQNRLDKDGEPDVRKGMIEVVEDRIAELQPEDGDED